MAFNSGSVSFCRLRVFGDGPATVDATTLGTLSEYAFEESDIGRPEEIESGFVAGDHIFDRQFTYEKNGFGDMLLFALRVDTNRVPSEVKRAYRQLHEQTLAQGNPSGFASKAQKKEAAENADHQVHEDLAAGKFRKSKLVPLLWDFRQQCLYCSSPTEAVIQQLSQRMHKAFNVELNQLSAGTLAGEVLRGAGQSRELEDLRPSAYTDAPPDLSDSEDDLAGPHDRNIPSVPWTTSSFETKDFLGNEFLIWLWHLAETREGLVPLGSRAGQPSEAAITLVRQLEMDCAWGATGRQSLRSDGPTRLPEAAEALATGKWPRKAGLILADLEGGEAGQWQLTLQGDRMVVSSAALPPAEQVESARELTEHRLLQLRTLTDRIDQMFAQFLEQRVARNWADRRNAIRQWIHARRRNRSSK